MYLIPAPAKMTEGTGSYQVSYRAWLNVEPGCSSLVTRQAALFNEEVKRILGYQPIFRRGKGQTGDIVIRQDDSMKAESYVLTITPDGVTLTGEEKGLWYGMQTLRQIMEQKGAVLPVLQIEDAPEIPNRGYYFDCARGRVPKLDWLKALADRMAYYKLNQLQLYIEHSYLFRDMTELWRDDTPLTAAEITELDAYCAERGIELVPSLSSFGHLYKLLSTKEYSHLCELPDSDKQPFSLRGRMHHHTIDVSNPEGIALIKEMITEYMELFSSRQFNICADETFDLGTGRSKEYVEKVGRDQAYIGYVRELAEFLLAHGRRPMFWGDIMWNFPEMIKELPEEILCLNWGYMWNQREEETKMLYDAGATQYCCPGCCAWNQYTAINWNAYNNVMRLCNYAKKYDAVGVLNTDWGDFLHINHPDFTRVGMIYGAAFSWNLNIPTYEDINRQISAVEFKDSSEKLLEIVGRIPENTGFEWDCVVRYRELHTGVTEYQKDHTERITEGLSMMSGVDEKNARLESIRDELYQQIGCLAESTRALVEPYIVMVDGMLLFNELGKVVSADSYGKQYEVMPDNWKLAKGLEAWLYHYKNIYRSVSKESELRRIEEIVCWYGDYLRDK